MSLGFASYFNILKSFFCGFPLKVHMNIKALYIHTCAHIQIYMWMLKGGVNVRTTSSTSLVTTLLTDS